MSTTSPTYASARRRTSARPDWRSVAKLAATYTVLVVGSILFLIPLIWTVSTSLKPLDQIFVYPIKWIPEPFVWSNYPDVFRRVPFLQYTINTIIITTFGVIGSLLGSSLAGYSFARLRFPGKRWMFRIMLATLMVPGFVTLIPSFIMFKSFGWLDTYLPILVPAFFATPYNTFLLRQFFLTIPPELEDAARIDGASTYRIFWSIILPLAKPALTTIAIFAFFYYWNEFLGPLIYLQSESKFPISLGISAFVSEHTNNYALMMAATTMALIPPLVLFFVAQRVFIQGVVVTGVKG
ncbi:MAG TPA: carbohydrate ABC transporter permease [Herpetosiphonaceae bacterium]|nr:carbohydrate ABC transporter permease [Herpetosiphonaceae bacterium]